MSVNHYENFPVASLLCPPAMRPAVVAVYQFARTADDLADEGEADSDHRRAQLARYRQALQAAAAGQPAAADRWPEVFAPLADTIRAHRLPVVHLHALLDAFEQDVGNPRYADRGGLLHYCQRSANPVGRLMLHLAAVDDPTSLQQSDAVCTALQLINFWQDPSVDLPRGRCYFTQADLARHGVDEAVLHAGVDTAATQAMLRELCHWAQDLMLQGAPLALRVPGRLGWELRLVVQGGLRILERIGASQFRSLGERPKLRPSDGPVLLWRALRMRRQHPPKPVLA